MKRCIGILSILILFLILAAACNTKTVGNSETEHSTMPSNRPMETINPPTPTQITMNNIIEKTKSGESHDENENSMVKSLAEYGKTVYAEELGVDSITSYFYWSPQSEDVLFMGAVKDSLGKYTAGVYLYNLKSEKVTSVVKGNYDTNYFFQEPVWSEDGKQVVISFMDFDNKAPSIHIYHMEEAKLETLPVEGFCPELSPDKTKLLYFSSQGSIHVYNLMDGKDRLVSSELKGFLPLWFSDNRHIVFCVKTGKNPSGLEGAELHDICIVNTENSEYPQILKHEKVYRNMKWLVQDSLLWIESGYDDGHYADLLDLNTNEYTEIGDGAYNRIQRGQGTHLILSGDGQWNVTDTDQMYSSSFQLPEGQECWDYTPLCCISYNKLLCWQNSYSDKSGKLLLFRRDEPTPVLLSKNVGYWYPEVSLDGSRLALIDSNEDFFILVDTLSLSTPSTDSSPISIKETEFVSMLMEAINNKDKAVLTQYYDSVYGLAEPHETANLPRGLELYSAYFKGDRLVNYNFNGIVTDRWYDTPGKVGKRYWLISETGLKREVVILQYGQGENVEYRFNDPLLFYGLYTEQVVKQYFQAIKAQSVAEVYNYFSYLSEGELQQYQEDGNDAGYMAKAEKILQQYRDCFQPDTLELVFTGYATNPLDASLRLEYEISGISPRGIPARHRVYGLFEYPLSGVQDKWMN